MIERTFGNFVLSIDAKADTVEIRGLRYGWRAVYGLGEIATKITLYRRLIARVRADRRPENPRYAEALEGLRWAKKMLDDV